MDGDGRWSIKIMIMLKKTMMTFLALLGLISCTEEFKVEIPDKDAWLDEVVDVDYDITFESLLDEISSMEETVKYPEYDYTTHLASSYDRASVAPNTPEWFSNNDGFGYVRKEVNGGRQEVVMMDHQGPGVITRIWLTSLTDGEATVRFYFDGNTEPDWTVDSYYLKDFDKSLEDQGVRPLGQGFVNPIYPEWRRGSNLYLPIPYGKGCKITYEERSTQPNPNRYFHINYRAYPAGTQIETFSANVFNAARAKVTEVNARLSDPKVNVSGRLLKASGTLSQDDALNIALTEGANAVSELRIEVSSYGSDYAEVMDNLIFSATFDGRQTACLSLADLATAGPGAPAVSNYFIECDGRGSLLVRFLMPYAESGSISVRNMCDKTADVEMSARVGAFPRDSRTLYFHAAAKELPNARLPYCLDYSTCYEWNFATILGGRGVLRADMYSMNNSTNDWPGEGDEKIYVDDETFPSHFGTGTEDYYGFCIDRPYQYPFVGESRLDNANFHGVDTYQRVRLLDAIHFDHKLKFDFEVGGWQVGTVDLRNAVIWYGDLETYAVGASSY